jgi:predicted kinase
MQKSVLLLMCIASILLIFYIWMRKNKREVNIFFITGTSGSGKSTLTKILQKKLPSALFAVYDFDENGVPSNADVEWRQSTTQYWLSQAAKNAPKGKITIICGVTLPSEVINAARKFDFTLYFGFMKINDEVIKNRLRDRKWDAQLIKDNINWAHHLENEVINQKNYSVIDCSTALPEQIANDFAQWILSQKTKVY